MVFCEKSKNKIELKQSRPAFCIMQKDYRRAPCNKTALFVYHKSAADRVSSLLAALFAACTW